MNVPSDLGGAYGWVAAQCPSARHDSVIPGWDTRLCARLQRATDLMNTPCSTGPRGPMMI